MTDLRLARFVSRCLVAAAMLVGAGGCADNLTPIPGTTTRVGRPVQAEGRELGLKIFTTMDDCKSWRIAPEDVPSCLPHVDRSSGEVRLGFAFLRKETESVYAMPEAEEYLQITHQGTAVQDDEGGKIVEVIGHDPEAVRRLYVLVIDGSSSMWEDNRMQKIKSALRRQDVVDSFFPQDVKSAVVLFQFTDGDPRPVGGQLTILQNRKQFGAAVEQLQVLSGYTHLYDAVAFASGALLKDPSIAELLDREEMGVTVIALTDGFNNEKRDDQCATNADRISRLLKGMLQQRQDKQDLRTRPTIYTVGLGKPLRPGFHLDGDVGTEVKPIQLCGKRFAYMTIDGNLERYGIDNASLAIIADAGGGTSYVKETKDGLAEAFRAAAPMRYRWFELRYRTDPFYLRRKFKTGIKLTSFATAEASVELFPSAWLDGPPGVEGEDGWTKSQSYLHTTVVVMPVLGLLVALSYVGAVVFNTRRVLFGRTRPGRTR